jgi:hypothetical protein
LRCVYGVGIGVGVLKDLTVDSKKIIDNNRTQFVDLLTQDEASYRNSRKPIMAVFAHYLFRSY